MRKKGSKTIKLPDEIVKDIHTSLNKYGEVRLLNLMRIKTVPYKSKTFYSGLHKREITVKSYKRVLINPLLGLKEFCKNL